MTNDLYARSPLASWLIMAGLLFLIMGWPTALGGGIGTYWALRRRNAKRV